MAAGLSPAAQAQPSDNQWPPEQFVSTAGNVRCVISQARVACQRMGAGFANAPAAGTAASVARDGTFSWDAAGIGGSTDPQAPELPLGRVTPYRWHGWTVMLGPDGTRLTNIKNTHGMLVSIDGATITPY
jgi:hypothetical protein